MYARFVTSEAFPDAYFHHYEVCFHGRFRIRLKSRTLVFGTLDSGDSFTAYFLVCWGPTVVSFMFRLLSEAEG